MTDQEMDGLGRPTVEDRRFVVEVDGEPNEARAGESVAALLFRTGRRVFRHSRVGGGPRSLFCGMGVCHDCLVTVNGRKNVRACMTSVEPGMKIETGMDGESWHS